MPVAAGEFVHWADVTVPGSENPAELQELFISSTVHNGEEIGVTKTSNHKCGRCWRHLPEVREDGGLCDRHEQREGRAGDNELPH